MDVSPCGRAAADGTTGGSEAAYQGILGGRAGAAGARCQPFARCGVGSAAVGRAGFYSGWRCRDIRRGGSPADMPREVHGAAVARGASAGPSPRNAVKRHHALWPHRGLCRPGGPPRAAT